MVRNGIDSLFSNCALLLEVRPNCTPLSCPCAKSGTLLACNVILYASRKAECNLYAFVQFATIRLRIGTARVLSPAFNGPEARSKVLCGAFRIQADERTYYQPLQMQNVFSWYRLRMCMVLLSILVNLGCAKPACMTLACYFRLGSSQHVPYTYTYTFVHILRAATAHFRCFSNQP